ncbi:hypothetical protein F3Y22_tig00117056pilonHSYRG01270 [Hibiscus syriacus]|uniref:Clathrin/coatomer adaptor adaptin-like N-terminal domain-containing protein n=1 Tax=Hibiscus syriacus TaxID=106335 RepID=A0A6A2WBN2_HIBSY|nr:hypothetical protein F3Y22_tig00117056pilonHSYRG01270 [Hibiscus syriacus]
MQREFAIMEIALRISDRIAILLVILASRRRSEGSVSKKKERGTVVRCTAEGIERKTLISREAAAAAVVRVPERFKMVALMAFVKCLCNADRVVMSVAIVPLADQLGWPSSFLGVVQIPMFGWTKFLSKGNISMPTVTFCVLILGNVIPTADYSLFFGIEKGDVLQEARVFNDSLILEDALRGFFVVTKLFQKDIGFRRMVYVMIKELSPSADEVIIVTNSLMNDMTSKTDMYRANAIHVLFRITDGTLLTQIERYLKQAIVDKNPVVASAALLSGIHLLQVVGSKCLIREFQDSITKIHWKAPCFSGDSAWVIVASYIKGEHKMCIWDRAGHLVKILEGPKEVVYII